MTDAPRIILDACVLAAPVRREALFRIAKAGFFAPLWSARIEGEWRRAAPKVAKIEAAAVDGDIALARLAFPNALVEGWEAQEGPLSLPDWNDRHVLAAAITGRAEMIITDNLRDFPARVLAVHGVTRMDADGFLANATAQQPQKAAAALDGMFDGAPVEDAPKLLKKARLPRLAKALSRL